MSLVKYLCATIILLLLACSHTHSEINESSNFFVPISANYVFPPLFLANPAEMKVNWPSAKQKDIRLDEIKVTDLPYEVVEIKVLDYYAGLKAGYVTASAEGSTSKAVIVESWRKFVPLEVGGKQVQYGVAINMATVVDFKEVRGAGTLFKALSIDASFRKITATVSAEVLGLTSKDITSNLPTSYAVLSTYSEIIRAKQQGKNYPLSGAIELASPMSTSFKTLKSVIWNIAVSENDSNQSFIPVVVGVRKSDL